MTVKVIYKVKFKVKDTLTHPIGPSCLTVSQYSHLTTGSRRRWGRAPDHRALGRVPGLHLPLHPLQAGAHLHSSGLYSLSSPACPSAWRGSPPSCSRPSGGHPRTPGPGWVLHCTALHWPYIYGLCEVVTGLPGHPVLPAVITQGKHCLVVVVRPGGSVV